MRIESFTLTKPTERAVSDGADETNAQKCFDALVDEYADLHKLTLTPREVRQFGDAFAARCVR